MAEAESLYRQVKSRLESVDGICVAGEATTFSHDSGQLIEQTSFFIAPVEPIDLDDDQGRFKDLTKRLALSGENSIHIAPGWRTQFLAAGTETMVFSFSALFYLQTLKGYEDLVNPVAYLEFLARTGAMPRLGLKSIGIITYPSLDYAMQIAINQQEVGRAQNLKMKYLAHSISRDQWAHLKQSPAGSGSLLDVPPPPVLYVRRTRDGN